MKIKAIALSVALGVTMIAGVTSTTPADATGFPVIDAANLANAIQQSTQMVEQLAQLKAQLDQAKQQYESLTGGRGMGNLVRSTGASCLEHPTDKPASRAVARVNLAMFLVIR